MKGEEKIWLNILIKAVVKAYRKLQEKTLEEAIQKTKYGKKDTFVLDSVPENIIKDRVQSFFTNAIFVTEETDDITRKYWPLNPDPDLQPLLIFSDPVDRTKYLKKFIDKYLELSKDNAKKKFGDIINDSNAVKIWEKKIAEKPAIITGATISVTCLRNGSILFSVIVNIITQTIFVACPAGVYQMQLPHYLDDKKMEKVDFDSIQKENNSLFFPPSEETCKSPDDFKRFVTFLGKSGYRENFDDSMIFLDDADSFLHHNEPGGPSRVHFLSDLQKNYDPIGFIMSNGEKITEWLPWLAWVKYAMNSEGNPALRIFEIDLERPMLKEGILMSTSKVYSIFRVDHSGNEYLDISILRGMAFPSHFRSMIVICPYDNETIIGIMKQHNYREINKAL